MIPDFEKKAIELTANLNYRKRLVETITQALRAAYTQGQIAAYEDAATDAEETTCRVVRGYWAKRCRKKSAALRKAQEERG